MPALAVAVLLTSAPSCGRPATVRAQRYFDGKVCFHAEDRVWSSEGSVPATGTSTDAVGGVFEVTGARTGTFTPDGGTPVPVRGTETQAELRVGIGCEIR